MKKFIIFLLFMPQLFYGQWVQQVSGTTENLNDVFAVTENLVFAVGDNGTILKTTDGGVNWVQKNSGTTQNLTKVQFATQNIGFAIGFNGVLLKTTDSGENWNLLQTNSLNDLFGLSVINETTTIVSGTSGLVIKSTNGGTSFSILTAPENNCVASLQFFGDFIGYAQVGIYNLNTGNTPIQNNFYKSIDGGLTWTLLNNSIDSFYFVNENLGFISKSDNHSINKTIDGGSNFTATGSSNLYELDIFSVNGNTVWDIGNNPALCFCDFLCVNKKEIVDFTVTQEEAACNNVFNSNIQFLSIYFANETIGYIAGTNGLILKNSSSVNQYLGSVNFEKYKSFTIAPNPTNDFVNIFFDQKQLENYKIEIIDNLGKKIFSKVFQTIENPKINTQAFLKGIYFLTVSGSEGQQTQKLIIN